MSTGNSVLIQSLKIVLISTGALFIAGILLSLSSEFRPSISAWLRPVYLYVIINCIIITIAASSRLHHAHPPESAPHAPPKSSPYGDVLDADSYYGGVKDVDLEVEVVKSTVPEVKDVLPVTETETEIVVDEMAVWRVIPPLVRQDPVDVSTELESVRLPASSRFNHHRRPAKASPAEGVRALRRVSKPKRLETLENTWKTITEGRAMPLTRHLKKSDTWQDHNTQINILDSNSSDVDPPMMKSETFKGGTNQNQPRTIASSSRLKKERSLSQDELNRRVEAFINKFNEEMRLQRQQSIQQYMDKISRT